MDLLSEIISAKRKRIEAAKALVPLDRMREIATSSRAVPHRLSAALRDRHRTNVIAEFKRRSPSKGPINSQAEPAATAREYEAAGAAAISVLTEEDYFDGSLDDLRRIREVSELPILRKDFIVDEYQVYESAAAGADALLLIVAALDDATLLRLRVLVEDELGIDALVEVHSQSEVRRAIACGTRIIGVNNRDLRTFEVSTATSIALREGVPPEVILVSESGLTPADVQELWKLGYSGFLIGETLMRSSDPSRALHEFIAAPKKSSASSVLVKICGITNLEDARCAINAGADMLGFNFYHKRPRFIERRDARKIIDAIRAEFPKLSVQMVGVFVNESQENIVQVAGETGLDAIQLHGEESSEFCETLKHEVPQLLVLKAIRPNGLVDLTVLKSYPVDAFMIDAFDATLHGGTGRVADWRLAGEVARELPRLFLAGGLSPENVAAAIAAVRPYAVDACSALESSPGKKDEARVRKFVAAARASKLPAERSIA